jgi:excinuclease UvrABC nuclease subunit
VRKGKQHAEKLNASLVAEDETAYDKLHVIADLEQEMREASSKLEFERAAHLRDQIATLKNATPVMPPQKKVKYPGKKKSKRTRVAEIFAWVSVTGEFEVVFQAAGGIRRAAVAMRHAMAVTENLLAIFDG